MVVFLKFIFCLCLLVNLSACSLLIAAIEEEEPDLSKIHEGSERTEVENILGLPIEECYTKEKGKYCTYEYKLECQSDSFEYFTVALIDIQTLGLFELFATPAAIIDCGKKGNVTIIYDKSNKVIESNYHQPEK